MLLYNKEISKDLKLKYDSVQLEHDNQTYMY